MPGGGGKGGKGGGSSNVNVHSTSASNSTMDLLGLDDIKLTTKLELPQPLKTESLSRNELSIKDPIRTEMATTMALDIKPVETKMTGDMSLDIKPVVLDLCFTVKIGEVPEMCLSRHYRHNFSLSVLGTEMLNLKFAGERGTVVEHLPQKPFLSYGEARATRAPRPSSHGPEEDAGITIHLGP